MTAFADYWGAKPYFETVELPVITDVVGAAVAVQQRPARGDPARPAVLGGAVTTSTTSTRNYSLPTMMSNYLYVNPSKGMMKDPSNRTALLQAIDVDELVKQTYFGRGKVGTQIYPPNMMAAEFGKQTLTHDPSALTKIAAGSARRSEDHHHRLRLQQPGQPADQQPVQTQLAAAGLTAKVQGYPTSEIYGWIGGDGQAAPEILAKLGWPDAPSPYTWGHISWDADGGLNYLGLLVAARSPRRWRRVCRTVRRGLLDGRCGSRSRRAAGSTSPTSTTSWSPSRG